MFKNLKKEIREIPSGTKEVKEFGLVGLIFFSAVTLVFFIYAHRIAWKLLALGVVLFVFCRLLPKLMRFVYIPAMIFALIMGAVMSRVILTLLYFTTMTPIGLIGRVCGKRFLDLEFRKTVDSYWIPKPKPADPQRACENQF